MGWLFATVISIDQLDQIDQIDQLARIFARSSLEAGPLVRSDL